MASDNCSELPKGYLPTTEEYFHSLSTVYVVVLSLCGVMTVASVLSYFESVLFLMRNLHNWKPKDKAIWLLGLYPVSCTTAFMGLMIPRSSTLNDMVSSLYLSLCVYLFVVMLMGHFGGQHKMSKKLASNKINLRSTPLCCCCFYLPQLDITTTRLRVLEFTVLQFAVFRPILAYIAAVMWSDDRFIAEDLDADSSYTWINVINILSTLLALYGFAIVYQLSRVPLQKMCVKPKFLVLQLVMILSTFQHVFISIFVVAGVVPCEGMVTAKANGDRWHHILFIVEIFTLSWFARYYYRRHVGDIPPEEQIITDTADTETMTTATLERQYSEKHKYGSVSGKNQNGNSAHEQNQTDVGGIVANGVPSVSQGVSVSDSDTNTGETFTDLSKAANPSGSDSAGSNNEMDDFIQSIVSKGKNKKNSRPAASQMFSAEGTQTAADGDQLDSSHIVLDMKAGDSQSEA